MKTLRQMTPRIKIGIGLLLCYGVIYIGCSLSEGSWVVSEWNYQLRDMAMLGIVELGIVAVIIASSFEIDNSKWTTNT